MKKGLRKLIEMDDAEMVSRYVIEKHDGIEIKWSSLKRLEKKGLVTFIPVWGALMRHLEMLGILTKYVPGSYSVFTETYKCLNPASAEFTYYFTGEEHAFGYAKEWFRRYQEKIYVAHNRYFVN